MNGYIEQLDETAYRVFPEAGIGWIPVHAHGEKTDYYAEYKGLKSSPIGAALLKFRAGLVRRYLPDNERVLDIGIGSGAFVEAYGNCYGYDVDPDAVHWLKTRGLFCDPLKDGALDDIHGVTFWDSLEHIRYPERILRAITTQYVFISIPVFADLYHEARRSKHFKPREHYLYFTPTGLTQYLEHYGFTYCESMGTETDLGRENIMTCVYRRKEAGA